MSRSAEDVFLSAYRDLCDIRDQVSTLEYFDNAQVVRVILVILTEDLDTLMDEACEYQISICQDLTYLWDFESRVATVKEEVAQVFKSGIGLELPTSETCRQLGEFPYDMLEIH